MALTSITPSEGQNPYNSGYDTDNLLEEKIEYELSSCGEYALQVTDGYVEGSISKRRLNPITYERWIQRFSLEQLRTIISTWD